MTYTWLSESYDKVDGGVVSERQVPGKRIRFVAGNDECHRSHQRPILKRRFDCRKLIFKVISTGRGVGKGNRGMTANRGYVIKANYYHGQVELNLADKLLDIIQNTHFRIDPLIG